MITLETANKLKEAGWSKETEFYHTPNGLIHKSRGELDSTWEMVNKYPCPSLEEILSELPYDTTLLKHIEYGYVASSLDNCYKCFPHLDPAEACAQLWLKLKQEGLL